MKHFYVSLFFLITTNLCGQNFNNRKYALLLGYNYNKGHFGEVGIVKGYRCSYTNSCEMIAQEIVYDYFSLSSEFKFDKQFIACPKIGYHLVLGVPHLGLSFVNYTNFQSAGFGIRPEVGLSLFGIASACYGYNWLTSYDKLNINKHNIGLKLIVGTRLIKEYKKVEN